MTNITKLIAEEVKLHSARSDACECVVVGDDAFALTVLVPMMMLEGMRSRL